LLGWGTGALVRRKHPGLELLGSALGGLLAGFVAGFLLWTIIRLAGPDW